MAASLKLSELTALTAVDDADLLLVTDSSATQSKKVTFSDFKTSLTSGLSVDDLRAAVGTTLGSGHMGTFTGSLIADNTSVKSALQALETATELRATAASPQFTGNLLTHIGSGEHPVVHRLQGGFPDFNFRTNGTDVAANQNEGRLLWEDAGGGGVAAIKQVMLPTAPMRFHVGGITASEERMRILANGRVGIGVTAPLAQLHINGSALVQADYPDFQMRSNGEKRLIFEDNGGAAQAAIKSSSNTLTFFTSGVGASDEAMRIASDGKIGVGTTSPDALLHVEGSIIAKADFPDVALRSGGERRVLFADAGGSAEGGIKFASNTLKIVVGGVASGNEIATFDADSADFKQTIVAEDGLTLDSVAITAVQTSSESFSDDDVSLMTSAAINDLLGTLGSTFTSIDLNGDGDVAGNITFSGGARDILITDNTADAFEILEGSNQYMSFTTTDNAEKVEIFKNLHLAGERFFFDAGSQLIRLKDNQTSALKIENHDGSHQDFLDFKTANSGPQLIWGAPNQVNNTITVGEDDTGYDVKFFGATASAYALWDESADDLILAGAAGLVVPDGQLTLGSTAVTSTAAEINTLDGVTAGTVSASKAVIVDSNKDLTGMRNLTLTGDLTVQGTTTTVNTVTMEAANAIVFEGATADDFESTLTVVDPTADRTIKLPNQSGCLPVLAADSATAITATPEELNILDGVTATAAEINVVDGVTAGTVAASKAVVVDANKDAASFRNVTLTGELDAATLDISGDADIDGTTNLDAVDIDGAVQADGTVTVGVDDTGYDVKFFGATSGAYMLWDESEDDLVLAGAAGLDIAGDIDVDGTSNLDVLDVDGTANFASTVEVNDTLTMKANINFTGSGREIRFKDNTYNALRFQKEDGTTYMGFDTQGDATIFFSQPLDVNTTMQIDGTVTVGVDDTGYDVKFFGASASAYMLWDESADDLILAGAAGLIVPEGQFTLGSTAVTSTAAELNVLDGVTAGTVAASKAVVVDSNKDAASFRNVTLTGELDAATLDISGDADIDGTTNLDAVDIDGATQIDGTVTVGVDDTGYDVKFFGATSGASLLWDESADDLILGGAAGLVVPEGQFTLGSTAVTSTAAELNLVDGITAGTVAASKAVIVDSDKDASGFRNVTLTGELDAATLDISGDADIDGTTNLDAVDIDGATQIDATVTVGVDDTGYDVKFFGATASAFMLWDESADDLILSGAAGLVVPEGQLTLGSTAVTSTAAEINTLDGVTAGTVAASKAVVVDSNKDATGFRNITATGELDAATLDISGDADIDGTCNLDNVDIDGNVDLSGDLTWSSNQDIYIPDNQQFALEYKTSNNDNLIRIDTRDTNPAGVYFLTHATFSVDNSHSSFNNNDMSFQLVNDTTLRIVVKGSDGTTRSVDLTLS